MDECGGHIVDTRLGTPSPFCRPFEFALQKGLEKSNTFLSASDMLFRKPITRLAYPPSALLVGLTLTPAKRRQEANCVESFELGPLISSCAEENDRSLPRPTCNLRLRLVWQ